MRHRFGPVFGRATVRLILVALATASMPARSDGWRDLKIDGTNAAGFETSVGALLNGLSSQRRANFEVALATLWITRSVDATDLDQDGHFGPSDLRLLKNESVALPAAIDRGDLLSAVEQREKKENKYSVASYLKDLDGLEYDEVIALTGQRAEPIRAAVKLFRMREMCRRATGEESWCRSVFFPTPMPPELGSSTRQALNEAIAAFNVQKYDEARSAIGKLQLDRLSPYERAKTEQILFQIAANQRNLGEAREHLVNAIDSGGLDDDEIERFLNAVRAIDEQIAAGADQ
jgi:tetratricopeptide (TPR) repeat protein